jgi:hypothetical protein
MEYKMSKQKIDYAELTEQHTDLIEELEFLKKSGAPKGMLSKKTKAIDKIAAVIEENKTEVQCDLLFKALETVQASLLKTVTDLGITFPVNVRFRFDSGKLVKSTVSAAVSGSSGSGTRSSGTLTYNGKTFPLTVACNWSDKRDFESASKSGAAGYKQIAEGREFKSYKEAAETVLQHEYPEVWTRYNSNFDNSKYHAASAHQLLQRMLKIDIDLYFTKTGTVNGPAAEENKNRKA